MMDRWMIVLRVAVIRVVGILCNAQPRLVVRVSVIMLVMVWCLLRRAVEWRSSRLFDSRSRRLRQIQRISTVGLFRAASLTPLHSFLFYFRMSILPSSVLEPMRHVLSRHRHWSSRFAALIYKTRKMNSSPFWLRRYNHFLPDWGTLDSWLA